MKKWKAIAGVLLVFILGGIAGTLGTLSVCRHRGEWMMRGGPHAYSEAVVRRLDHALKLDAGQHRQVEAIVAEAHAEMREVRKEVQPRIDAIFEKAVGRVNAILRPEQREKFEKMVQERRERKKRWHN